LFTAGSGASAFALGVATAVIVTGSEPWVRGIVAFWGSAISLPIGAEPVGVGVSVRDASVELFDFPFTLGKSTAEVLKRAKTSPANARFAVDVERGARSLAFGIFFTKTCFFTDERERWTL